MFWTGFLSIIRSIVLYNCNRCTSYRVCWLLANGNRMDPDSVNKQSTYPVWHTPIVAIQYYTPDYGQKTCPEHVAFYSKNKFEKLIHLVGFIIRMYHDTRYSECQIISTVCFHTWWYEQPQETQGHVPENEVDFLLYMFVCSQIV